jgi:micrococcal nuclease
MKMYKYNAVVTRVVDGDTLDLDIDLGLHVHIHERVRLAEIDTPEIFGVKKESPEYALGMQAKERVEDLVLNKPVIIETIKDKKGKYGRYIVHLWTNDDLENTLSEILINEGLGEFKEY